jgi:hypothetical protein
MGTTTRALTSALAALLGVLALPAATVEASSPSGIGRMRVTPTIVTAGSANNELTFTFTADSSSLKGQTIVDVPRGWTYPQLASATAPGHVELKRGTCGSATKIASVKTRRITIATACGRRRSFQLLFHKATAPEIAADGYIFLARSRSSRSGRKAKFKPLGRRKQPIVKVRGGPAASLFVGVTTVATVGVPFSVTVRAVDAYGNNAYPYIGPSVSLKTTDPTATLPGPYSYVQTDAAQHVFTGVTLRTAGKQSITATDSNGLTMESTPIDVLPASSSTSYLTSAFAASLGA